MKRVLIIDDEPLIRQALKKLLIRNELEVVVVGEAGNGIEALSELERTRADILFLDVRMPLMNGFDLLQRLQERNMAVMTIILTAYRDFDYAARAIEYGAFGYLVKPIDEKKLVEMTIKAGRKIDEERQAETAKRQLAELRKTSYLERLLAGEETGFAERPEGMPDFLDGCGRLVVVRSSNGVDSRIGGSGDPAVIAYKGELILLYRTARELTDEELAARLTKDGAAEHPCGISAPFAREENIRLAYRQAKAALFYRDAAGEPPIYRFAERMTAPGDEPDALTDQRRLEQLSEKLELGLLDEAWTMIRGFTETLELRKDEDLDAVYRQYYQFATAIKHNLPRLEAPEPVKKQLAELGLAELAAYSTLSEIDAFFERLFAALAPAATVEDAERVVHKIKAYIRENYAQDISLHLLAERLYLSKNYISAVFKQKTGVNFLEYLTNVRMEQAKLRLERTEKGVHQIAEEVGYKNTSHFGKVFKQTVGVTPAEYRQRRYANP
ncbi:response regulator [Cohnella sp. LGH]|uniref:response regulator n=1 Tax=Cohnella sp. LGH TaxID=1619153 RepID=UPI001ADC1FF1|nr:response regulator [Cohnella sp. LGH]QTH42407.1 response regulator [Cohnella sp. LGH]